MKKFLFSTLLVLTTFSVAQMPPFDPSKELKRLDFMTGTWRGPETMYFGPQPTKSRATVTCGRAVGGTYLESTHLSDMGKEKMHGRQLLTYDPAKKMYIGYWFDSTSAGAMTLRGNFQDAKTFRMLSDPTEIPGVGKMVFRATWTKVNARNVTFKLESQQGANWVPMIEAKYTKSR